MIATDTRPAATDQGAATGPADYIRRDSSLRTATAVTSTQVQPCAQSRPACGRPRARRDIRHAGVIAAAAALFIAVSAFAGAGCYFVLADRAAAATRLEIARTAATVITTLWTYNPDTIDTLSDRAGDYLDGELCSQYRQFLRATVARARQARVSDKTDVVGIAVESLNRSNATVLVFTNTAATSPHANNAPSLKQAAYRLAMKKTGPRWLVTAMTTISFVDLTPEIEPETGGAGGQ